MPQPGQSRPKRQTNDLKCQACNGVDPCVDHHRPVPRDGVMAPKQGPDRNGEVSQDFTGRAESQSWSAMISAIVVPIKIHKPHKTHRQPAQSPDTDSPKHGAPSPTGILAAKMLDRQLSVAY